MKRAVAMVVAGAALVGALVWGCATASHDLAANQPRDWKTYEPDGGWQNYIPPKRLYAPDPFRTNRSGTPVPGPIQADPGGLPLGSTPTTR